MVGSVPDVLKAMYTMDFSTGNLLAIEKSLPEDEEHKLGFDEWHQAWGHLLELIKTHLPHIHDHWRCHFERIVNTPTQAYQWDTWRLYDIELRKQSVHKGIDPGIFSKSVWDFAES
jgi:hypothetical protein